jgi:hypothetical protein
MGFPFSEIKDGLNLLEQVLPQLTIRDDIDSLGIIANDLEVLARHTRRKYIDLKVDRMARRYGGEGHG